MSPLLQAASALSDYTSSLVQAIIVLAATAALAYVSLRFGAARGLLGAGNGKLIQIEDRVRLDARSQLVVVQIEGRRLLLATHTHDAARLLLELGPGTKSVQGAKEPTA